MGKIRGGGEISHSLPHLGSGFVPKSRGGFGSIYQQTICIVVKPTRAFSVNVCLGGKWGGTDTSSNQGITKGWQSNQTETRRDL